MLKIPLINDLVLASAFGKECGNYKLKDIPNYDPGFKIGDKVRYYGQFGGVLSSEPNAELGYNGYEIENNITAKGVIGKNSGKIGFGYLKDNQIAGEVKKINLNLPYWDSPKCLVEFNLPYINEKGVKEVTLIKLVLEAKDLKKVG
jgi:hypothetical protein